MRKDIDIPEVKDVYVAAVKELHAEYKTEDWNAYIINDGDSPLEMVLIVAQGYDDKDMTSHMRHKIAVLPAKGYAKIEFMEESIFRLNNFFSVTYFLHNKMYEKRWEFPANTITDDNAFEVPVMRKKGVLAR
ncbi:MAG: hypothetical protein ACI828_000069 [Flavobacteriales bacterium]|jgi:hypothetical protein